MEEIYIIKLKGLPPLPPSNSESLRDNTASFYYSKDLTGEALLGFGISHTFIGVTLIVLSIINLLIANLGQQLGAGVWCGAIFVIAGLMGVVTSQKRKRDISKSKIHVKIYFMLSLVTIILTSTYFVLMMFGMKESSANTFISSNIMLSFLFELILSLLSIFTCVRVIWPGSLSCCAKDWPGHPKLKRKVIVATQIYTNGVKQDEDLIRNLGPNCVISLSPPQLAMKDSDNYIENDYSISNSCPCCDTDYMASSDTNYQSSGCHNHSRSSSTPTCDQQYDSDFDTEQFDSIVEHEDCDRDLPLQETTITIEANHAIGDNSDNDSDLEVIHNNHVIHGEFKIEEINECVDRDESSEPPISTQHENCDDETGDEADKQFNYCTFEKHKNCCEKTKHCDETNV